MTKAVFYTYGGSVWAAAAELAIQELGYSENEIVTRVVSLPDGENFHPDFIKINPNATLPTLTAEGITYPDTESVIAYLVSKSSNPVGRTNGKKLIRRVHEESLDPNFALLLSRSDEEKKIRGSGLILPFLSGRQSSLEKHSASPEGKKFTEFYIQKKRFNSDLLALYADKAPDEVKSKFYETSITHWNNIRAFILDELPGYLPNSGFIGGTYPAEEDFHLGAWLARIVATTGDINVEGLKNELGKSVPQKIVAYWDTWSVRESWKTTYAGGIH